MSVLANRNACPFEHSPTMPFARMTWFADAQPTVTLPVHRFSHILHRRKIEEKHEIKEVRSSPDLPDHRRGHCLRGHFGCPGTCRRNRYLGSARDHHARQPGWHSVCWRRTPQAVHLPSLHLRPGPPWYQSPGSQRLRLQTACRAEPRRPAARHELRRLRILVDVLPEAH